MSQIGGHCCGKYAVNASNIKRGRAGKACPARRKSPKKASSARRASPKKASPRRASPKKASPRRKSPKKESPPKSPRRGNRVKRPNVRLRSL